MNLKAKQRALSQGRCHVAEYHGNNRATFECKAGHRWTARLFPPAPNGKFPSEAILVKFARYWSKMNPDGSGGRGVTVECKRCTKERASDILDPVTDDAADQRRSAITAGQQKEQP